MRPVAWGIALALALVGCGSGDAAPKDGPRPEGPDTCEAPGAEDRTLVIQQMRFARAEDGVSDGFDLDGSATSDAGGCGITDFQDPAGAADVDNAFAYLLPALELTEAAAVESLIQAAIDSGQLMVTFELRDLDDPVDDPCVELVVGRATGAPMVGTDGRLLPGQTLERDAALPPVVIEDVAVVDGVFVAPFAITLPVTIFEIDLEFTLIEGRIRGTIQPDGTVVGVFAGGVDIAYLLSIAREENVDPGLHDILAALLGAWADLAPDPVTGECGQISITFEYETVGAFFFE